MRLMFVGDVFGESGTRCVQDLIPVLRDEYELDVVVVNGENAARGVGITDKHARRLLQAGTDAITLGNHAFRQREIFPMLDDPAVPIVRPANVASRAPGRGMCFVPFGAKDGSTELAVINLMGSIFLDVGCSPFEIVDDLVDKARARTPFVLVDMHAEATSEKVAMGLHLDGRVSAVVGTHTHVQTSDARVLPNGSAYITDVGMSGPHAGSVIGVRADIILRRFLTGVGERFAPATDGVQLEGVVIDLDDSTGRAISIDALRRPALTSSR